VRSRRAPLRDSEPLDRLRVAKPLDYGNKCLQEPDLSGLYNIIISSYLTGPSPREIVRKMTFYLTCECSDCISCNSSSSLLR
jgi:hypothetical protein